MCRNMAKFCVKERPGRDCQSDVEVGHQTQCLSEQGNKYRHTCTCTQPQTHTDITNTHHHHHHHRTHPRTRTPHHNTPTTRTHHYLIGDAHAWTNEYPLVPSSMQPNHIQGNGFWIISGEDVLILTLVQVSGFKQAWYTSGATMILSEGSPKLRHLICACVDSRNFQHLSLLFSDTTVTGTVLG